MRYMIFRLRRRALKGLNNSGATFAEMLINVILVSLFSIAVVGGIITAFRVSSEVEDAAYVRELADILIDRVSGEIENAISIEEPELLQSGKQTITFESRSGVPITIKVVTETDVDEAAQGSQPVNLSQSLNRLMLHYHEKSNGVAKVSDSYWTYDASMYKTNSGGSWEVTDLSFKALSTSVTQKPYIIKVSLELTNSQTGQKESFSSYVNIYGLKQNEEQTD